MTNKDVAIQIARLGVGVFPCDSDKKPLTPHGFYDASTDEAKITEWWSKWPKALPSLWPGASGLVVIDLDRKNGHKGPDAFEAFCNQHGIDQSQFFSVQTPSKGFHLYFRTSIGYGNAHSLPDGIDVRGLKGYCVAAGAPGYKIVWGTWQTIPALPDALAAFLTPATPEPAPMLPMELGTRPPSTWRERAYAESTLADEVEKLSALRQGQGRNAALNAAALHMGEMVSAGWIERSTVESALWEASAINGYRAKDGDSEGWKTLQSGLQAGILKPRDPLPIVTVEQCWHDMIDRWIAACKAKQSSFIESIRSPFDYESAPLDYLIDDLIPLPSIVMFSGKPGCGKSTLVMKMADAIAEGKSFMGKPAKPARPVLYLDRENPIAIVKERLTRLHIAPGKRFKYWGGHLSVDVPMPGSEGIKQWVANTNPKPVIFVDSLIRFVKGKENDSEVISAFFEPLRTFTHLGCTVVFLHHVGKNEDSEYRGSSDIEGAIDVGYRVINADREALTNMKLKLIKGRITVASEVAFTYSNGEFIPQELKAAREHNLMKLLRMNPGIIKSEFEKLAMSKQASRNEVRDFIDTGIGFGTILTRQGERNAKLLYLPDNIPPAC